VPIDIYCLTIFPSRGRDVHNEPDLQHSGDIYELYIKMSPVGYTQGRIIETSGFSLAPKITYN